LATPPEFSLLADDQWILRRILPGGRYRQTGQPRPAAFNLRVARGETSLSFYLAGADPDVLLRNAPQGSGIVRLRVRVLRQLNFTVTMSPDSDDPLVGHLHVAAIPDFVEGGQIPLETRAALADSSEWLIEADY